MGCEGCRSSCGKLDVHDWLKDLPEGEQTTDLVEIRFKNTRKGFFRNTNRLRLEKGDVVAVEASPGHDIGIVNLTGNLVLSQVKKYNNTNRPIEYRKVYRKAKPADIDKWKGAIEMEHPTMIETRQIVKDLRLNMKIGDVEYQGDKTKAIFYYIADERVDFRELIRVLADRFRIRVEMKQIGARQEAGLIGGIGSCGRELCCSTWLTNFVSVSTNAARYQEISLNPQKLAGQCGKLKCCLNYELDVYIDARKDFPSVNAKLETENGLAVHQKTDIFKRIMYYSFEDESALSMIPITIDRVKEILKLNRKGIKVKGLTDESLKSPSAEPKITYEEESLTRFDNKFKNKGRKKRGRNPRRKPRK